mmetsp:Transcript_26841/g.44220  ORF Transcript_26841/g.44220 Transcript_26841/m.44220 type:complete len:227 (-) Transcript_26841:1597-2277(-)
MTLDVGYSYCINLTEEEKLEIDKQVRNNRFELKFAIFFTFLPFPIIPQVPFFPVEGFSPQQIVRNARDRVESAVEERLRPLAEAVDDCREAYNEYKEVKETIESNSKKKNQRNSQLNRPRSVSESFETNAVKKLSKTSLKNPRLQKEYESVKALLKEGVHPVNLSEKSTYVSSTKVLVKKPEGRYLIEVSDTSAEIVGISSRTNQKCMSKFKKLMNELYNLDIKGY